MFRLHRAAIVSSKPSSPERIPRKQFFFPSRRFGFGCLINGWTEYASESIFHFQKPQHATIPGTRVVELFTTKLEKKWKQNERFDRLKWRNTEIGAFHEFSIQTVEHFGWFDPNDSVNRTRIEMKCTRIECSTLTSAQWSENLGGFWLMDTFEMLVIKFTLIRLLTTSHDSSRTCLSLVHAHTKRSRENLSI